jgi:TRAP-type uncharacterized transport system fused permease subunit
MIHRTKDTSTIMATYFIDFNGNVLPIVPADFGLNTSIPQWFELSEIQHAQQTILAQIAYHKRLNQELMYMVTTILCTLVYVYILFIICCIFRQRVRR